MTLSEMERRIHYLERYVARLLAWMVANAAPPPAPYEDSPTLYIPPRSYDDSPLEKKWDTYTDRDL